jgi:hypothetical protein
MDKGGEPGIELEEFCARPTLIHDTAVALISECTAVLQKEDEAAAILFSIYDLNKDGNVDQREMEIAVENSALPVLRKLLPCNKGYVCFLY